MGKATKRKEKKGKEDDEDESSSDDSSGGSGKNSADSNKSDENDDKIEKGEMDEKRDGNPNDVKFLLITAEKWCTIAVYFQVGVGACVLLIISGVAFILFVEAKIAEFRGDFVTARRHSSLIALLPLYSFRGLLYCGMGVVLFIAFKKENSLLILVWLFTMISYVLLVILAESFIIFYFTYTRADKAIGLFFLHLLIVIYDCWTIWVVNLRRRQIGHGP